MNRNYIRTFKSCFNNLLSEFIIINDSESVGVGSQTSSRSCISTTALQKIPLTNKKLVAALLNIAMYKLVFNGQKLDPYHREQLIKAGFSEMQKFIKHHEITDILPRLMFDIYNPRRCFGLKPFRHKPSLMKLQSK